MNIQLIDKEDVLQSGKIKSDTDIIDDVCREQYNVAEKILDNIITGTSKIGTGREMSYLLPSGIAIMVDYSGWYSQHMCHWHGVSKDKCEKYISERGKLYIVLKCEFFGIFPIPGDTFLAWFKDLKLSSGSWKFKIIHKEKKTFIKELDIDISAYRNKMDILIDIIRPKQTILNSSSIMIPNTRTLEKDVIKKKCKELYFEKKILVASEIPWENNYNVAALCGLNHIFPNVYKCGESVAVVDCETGKRYDTHIHPGRDDIINAGLRNLWSEDDRYKKFHEGDIIGIALDPEDDHILYVCFKYKKDKKEDIKVNEPQKIIDEPQKIIDEPQKIIDEPQKIIDEPQKIIDENGGIKLVDENGGIKLVDDMKKMEELLLNKKQIILYGPPGTGKTWKARELAKRFIKDEGGQIEFITFHPSYGYEEFMERITVPAKEEGEQVEGKFILMSGIFKNLCKRALIAAIIPENAKDFQPILEGQEFARKMKISDIKELLVKGEIPFSWKKAYDTYKKAKEKEEKQEKDEKEEKQEKDIKDIKDIKKVNFESAQKFVLIIDEINRGYISKIFGELITLIEKDKRLDEDGGLVARLLYSGEIFGVPPNVYIIGTMNTADRSIDLLDIALRRRFGFIEMVPDFNVVQKYIDDNKEKLDIAGIYNIILDSIKAIEKINERICKEQKIGRDKQIGHSYLLQIKNASELIMAWQNNIIPLIEEYCISDYSKINDILFNDEDKSHWIDKEKGMYIFENIDDIRNFIKDINSSN